MVIKILENTQICKTASPTSLFLLTYILLKLIFTGLLKGVFIYEVGFFFVQTIITQNNGFHHDIFIMNTLYVFILFTLVSPVLLPLPLYPIPLPKNPLFYSHALKNNLDSNYELEHMIHASLCVCVESFSENYLSLLSLTFCFLLLAHSCDMESVIWLRVRHGHQDRFETRLDFFALSFPLSAQPKLPPDPIQWPRSKRPSRSRPADSLDWEPHFSAFS